MLCMGQVELGTAAGREVVAALLRVFRSLEYAEWQRTGIAWAWIWQTEGLSVGVLCEQAACTKGWSLGGHQQRLEYPVLWGSVGTGTLKQLNFPKSL